MITAWYRRKVNDPKSIVGDVLAYLFDPDSTVLHSPGMSLRMAKLLGLAPTVTVVVVTHERR